MIRFGCSLQPLGAPLIFVFVSFLSCLILQSCRFVILMSRGSAALAFCRFAGVLSAILPFCRSDVLSFCGRSVRGSAALSFCGSAILRFCSFAILSFRCFAVLSSGVVSPCGFAPVSSLISSINRIFNFSPFHSSALPLFLSSFSDFGGRLQKKGENERIVSDPL